MWKGYLLQMQPYPWWTPYLEPPFVSDLGSPPDYIQYLIQTKHDEIRWILYIYIFRYIYIYELFFSWSLTSAKTIYIYIYTYIQNKRVKRIHPPNAAIPLVNPILRTSLSCQIWDLHLIIYIYTWFKRNMMKYDELNIYKYIWSSLWYPLQQGGGSKYLVLRGSKCELRTPSFWFRVLSSHLEPRAIFEIFSNFFRNEVLSSCPRLYILYVSWSVNDIFPESSSSQKWISGWALWAWGS